jgi:hypothetical protein
MRDFKRLGTFLLRERDQDNDSNLAWKEAE